MYTGVYYICMCIYIYIYILGLHAGTEGHVHVVRPAGPVPDVCCAAPGGLCSAGMYNTHVIVCIYMYTYSYIYTYAIH